MQCFCNLSNIAKHYQTLIYSVVYLRVTKRFLFNTRTIKHLFVGPLFEKMANIYYHCNNQKI